MQSGLMLGLIFMASGLVLSFSGRYDESLRLSIENIINMKLLTDGAGLMYIGTLVVIASPVAVLIYLAWFYLRSDRKIYGLYCLGITAVLTAVVLMRI